MTTALDRAREGLAKQRRWIEEHGGDRAGYIARYGQPHHLMAVYGCSAATMTFDGRCLSCGWTGMYGDGGSAIYAADKAELDRLEQDYARALARAQKRSHRS